MRRTVITVSAVLLVVVGCGGAENEPNLARAVERTEATGSSRIEVRAALGGSGNQSPLRCEGAADYERDGFQLSCNDSGDTISIGDTMYFTSEVFGVRVDKRWVKLPLDKAEADSLRNFSPEGLLRMLREASLDTVRVGEETVREVATVQYRLTVNCEEALIGCPGTTAPVDVWIDDGGLVRRIELEDNGHAGTIEFFDFGIEVDIEPPPPDQVANLDNLGSGLRNPCGGQEASPISERQALDALRRHALTVRRDGSGPCPPDVAAVLENAPENFDQQGYVSCFLYARPRAGATRTVVRRGADGADARLALANLVCVILADSPNAEEKIRPLQEAFEDLERAIRP